MIKSNIQQSIIVFALLMFSQYCFSLNNLPPGVGIIGGGLVLAEELNHHAADYTLKEAGDNVGKYKIMVIVPVVTTAYNAGIIKEIKKVQAPDFQIDFKNLSKGTNFIESRYAEYLDTGDIVSIAIEAEKDGYDAIFVTCFGEPGVSEARELVDIPVIGGFLGGGVAANLVSRRFTIVSVVESVVPMLRELADTLGIEDNLTSIRQIGVPVAKLSNLKLVEEKLIEQSIAAIQKEGAQAILMGCTGLLGVREFVENAIQQKLQLDNPVPVLAPNQLAITHLQGMVRMGLTQSRLAFYRSNAKPALQ